MLSKFCVEGFKNFSEKFVLDLSKTSNYEFNTDAVNQGIVNKGIIYGFNGCGKSNLGLALFDIVSHLTNKQCNSYLFTPYLCLEADFKFASFEYHFNFQGQNLIYSYQKSDFGTLIAESLSIAGRKVLQYDFQTQTGFTKLSGTETLNFGESDSEISRVKFIRSNAILPDTPENKLFLKLIRFVDNMLLFYSLENNRYIGLKTGNDEIGKVIVRERKTKDFEYFLRKCNVNISLSVKEVDGEPSLMAHYKNADVSFFRVASSGTKALALFYYWSLLFQQTSFVFMDEFDAFYHFELSEQIVELLKPLKNTQILLTTHNTDLLSNDLLRPDCFFWMYGSCITPLCDLTEKEIRKAHNLQKMFKAGAFNV